MANIENRHEADSRRMLRATYREDAAEEAREWSLRLLSERVSLRDQSAMTVRHHVARLIELCYRLHAENEATKKAFEQYKHDEHNRAHRQYVAMRRAEARANGKT